MRVLLSIKPEYAEKILSGEKKFEFRRILPKKREVKKAVIYASLPVGKVVGEFEIAGFISENSDRLWEIIAEFSGVSMDSFNDYFKGKEISNAIKIGKVTRYEQAKDLVEILPSGRTPQSFCYIK